MLRAMLVRSGCSALYSLLPAASATAGAGASLQNAVRWVLFIMGDVAGLHHAAAPTTEVVMIISNWPPSTSQQPPVSKGGERGGRGR